MIKITNAYKFSVKKVKDWGHTLLSISGFVPEHLTVTRAIFMFSSIFVSVFIFPDYKQLDFALLYFITCLILYIGFIFLTLQESGLRLQLIKKFGEKNGYLIFEGLLAFAFFHNGASLTFISQSSVGSGVWGDLPQPLIISIALILFSVGMVIKIWSAHLVGTPIYYWKDMFLGRKVSDFVVKGPYKYLSNPMYGIGQIQVYAIAIYYNSSIGLIAGAINQSLVFLFYYQIEKPFIIRTYRSPKAQN